MDDDAFNARLLALERKTERDRRTIAALEAALLAAQQQLKQIQGLT
jgi:uncharacterized coiled-coil protein SlyX